MKCRQKSDLCSSEPTVSSGIHSSTRAACAPYTGRPGRGQGRIPPQLGPRALYWFRWGAAWTWVTGILLLFFVFWWSDPKFHTGPGIVMILVTLLAFVVYDALFSMDFAKDLRVGGAVGLVLVVVIVSGGYITWAGFGYRDYVIHTGAMFGTIMAANVWMRIWPLQKKIITAVRDGTPPDPTWAPLAGARSRHNTYLSVPLVWTMINSHTTAPFASSPVYLFVMIVIGWGAVYLLYQNTARVKGF